MENRRSVKKNLMIMLALGLASAVLAKIQFVLPGLDGAVCDPREIAALISVFFLPSLGYVVGVAVLAALGGPYDYIPVTVGMHLLAIPAAWMTYRLICRRVKTIAGITLCWALFVPLLYVIIFGPAYAVLQSVFEGTSHAGLVDTYRLFVSGVYFELVLTTVVTTLFLYSHLVNAVVRQKSSDLEQREQLLDAVMDNTFQFQALLTTEGRLLKVNSAPLALIGVNESDVLGRYFWETPWWTHDAQEQTRLKEAIAKGAAGESVRYETTHRDPAGETHYVDFSLKPLWNEATTVQCLIAEGHDITSLIERERYLRDSEQRFQKLFEESPVTMSLNELETSTFVAVNRKFCEANGVTPEQVIGKTSRELGFVSQEEADRLVKILEQKGKIENEEIVSQSLDGKKRHELLSTTFLDFNDSTYALSMLIDITERRRSQEALRQSEQKYRHIFEHSPVGIYRSTLEGRMITANPVMATQFGYDSPEQMTAMVTDIAHQCYADAAQRENVLQQLTDGHDIFSEEIDFLRQDGSTFTGRLFLCEDRSSSDSNPIFYGFVLDMTKEKVAQQESRANEQKLRTITESVNDLIWEVDQDLKHTYVNPGVEQFLGWTEPEMLTLYSKDIMPTHSYEKVLCALAEERRHLNPPGERFRTLQLELLRKDGSTFWGEVSGRLLLDKDGSFRIIGVTRDITERKKTEQVMIDAEKMMMVSGLAAGMAHEINTPLGIVLQNAQNIERRLSPQLESNVQAAAEVGVDLDRVRDYLERRDILAFLASMRQAGERATKIVSNMLAFSRKGSTGQFSADINHVIDKAIEIAQSDYDLKKKYDIRNVQFVRNFTDNLPAVTIDETEIEQVLINLFKNAAQAMAGQVGSAEPTITITSELSGPYVVVRIRDNGPGMSPQVRSRIFEPFFTTKDVGSGTGLGLYVSYSIITSKHRGHLSVASEPGQGAIFTIELPAQSGGHS
ncbi:MAG: PAS domain S-box protein [Desulfuromonadaceae bacterium]|nr:PAS domain S-box protein [Desulfuromonadaceae bacterium]